MASDTRLTDQSIWSIDFNDLAKQICLKDLELLKLISIEEINSFHWTKSNKKAQCPNLMISNKQFNKINLWVQREILSQKISMLGIKVLSKFIKLSKRLLDHRNYQSAYAVKSALHSTPIFRLEYLWSEISKKDKMIWQKLSYVFDVEDNYNNLRHAMSERKRPSIPFIGVYLSDLTGLDAAYPKNGDIEPEPRKAGLEKIYNSIRYFQASKYDFKWHSGLQEYLHSMEYMEEFQNYIIDSLFNLSKAREPDSNGHKSGSSSLSSNYLNPQSPNRPHHRKSQSLESDDRKSSYRKISENERQSVFFPDPESPTPQPKDGKSLTLQIPKFRNLLDDSVVELRPSNSVIDIPKENSIGRNSSYQCLSPSSFINNKWSDGGESPALDRISVGQTFDPVTSSASRVNQLIIEGSLKRKIKTKSSTFCISSYQKVLARLYTTNLDCYLNFYSSKIPKPKTLTDFREDPHIKISLIEAHLEYKKFSSTPKIILQLPHETYVLKSIDDVGENWAGIEQWNDMMTESINNVKSSKASISQRIPDLIDLEMEFTRL